ncbi:MAG: 4Fe-4S dicluster domain-containing protein, partial [bacterium]
FGGGWMYAMDENIVSLGLVTSLSTPNPRNDPHRYFQLYKTHPLIKSLLSGGKMIKYGAKTIAEGGYWAMPQLYHHHLLMVGESAGFLNARRLKGIHLSIKSGIMAAETAFDALREENYSEESLSRYQDRFKKSWAYKELWKVRNFHQPYSRGLWNGLFHTALQIATGGRGFYKRYPAREDHLHYKPLSQTSYKEETITFDNQLLFDKLTDVYASGTRHEENQPPHLRVADLSICSDRCTEEYGNPCQHFCPAAVYEMVPREDGKLRLQINAANCVHCKTCDIADPYGIITWVPPEGGGGPRYLGL